MIAVGACSRCGTLSGAVQTVMWALNARLPPRETRGFLKQRLMALTLIGCVVTSFALVFVLLVRRSARERLGRIGCRPHVAGRWVWWTAQWPILLVGLLTMFAIVLLLGPTRWHRPSGGSSRPEPFRRRRLARRLRPLRGLHQHLRLVQQGVGSLAAVIVMLTWLWLSGSPCSSAARSTPSSALAALADTAALNPVTGRPVLTPDGFARVLIRCYRSEKGEGGDRS